MEERKTSEALRKAVKKYNASKTFGLSLRLNKETDSDIIKHLEQIENRQGYIKDLIRQDIKNNI